MKKLKTKNLIKQIICIMIVFMLCNFIIPSYTYAVDTAEGGSLMEVIAQFLCFIPDAVINIMQDMFVAPEKIQLDDESYSIKYSPGVIFSGQVPALDINFITPGTSKTEDEKTYESTAAILQPIVATWYKALRRIALVGLLSAIVYIGIKIVLSSTSAKEKAKYKSMLKDWIIALCLLFTLHYIMSITITVVDNINGVIRASAISSSGEDVLMTTIRNKILNGEKWNLVLTDVVIYFVLVVYTVIYTIQYIRRVIYIAFLTMIAPLITLTYPLDKIKDNKSQAFDMWIKDYVFFSLIQVVHLLIYYIFLGSAINLSVEGNWIYAIVAIGFITPAEKLIKKMFGFEKSKSLGALGAGATGALVMNAIQKIPQGGGSKGGSAGKQEKTGTDIASGVRTAGVNPFVNYSDDTPTSSPTRTGVPVNGYQTGETGGFGNSEAGKQTPKQENSQEQESKLAKILKGNRLLNNEHMTSFGLKLKRNLKGAKAVAGRYFAPVAGGTIRLMASTTGAILGVSAAIVKGENLSDIGTGALAGVAAGKGAVNIVEDGIRKVRQIPDKISDVVDTAREGAYGTEIAQNARFDRVFRSSKEYKELREKSGFSEREFDRKVQKMLDSGIKDIKKMKKILKNHRLDPKRYTMDNSIKLSKLADKCSEEILYDKVKFIRFCEDRKLGISEEQLAEIRKDIMNFK